MAAIPLAARGRFVAEFPALLENAARILSTQMLFGDEVEVILDDPIWIDDGATNVTVNFDFQDASGTSFAKSTTTFDHAQFAASGMEARSGETGKGSTGGDSPTAEGGDAQKEDQ
jgi:hypothetical protein